MTQKELLDIYTDYPISQTKYATATGLEALLEGELSHDKISRFLKQYKFGAKDLWKYIKPEVRKFEKEKEGVLIIDDTIEEKPYTDENEIICWHFSHAKGRCIIRDQPSIMPCALWRRGISILRKVSTS